MNFVNFFLFDFCPKNVLISPIHILLTAMEIINFKQKKMKSLTSKKQKLYKNAKIYYICEEKFEDEYAKDEKFCKVRDHCYYTDKYRGAAQVHLIGNIVYLKKLL